MPSFLFNNFDSTENNASLLASLSNSHALSCDTMAVSFIICPKIGAEIFTMFASFLMSFLRLLPSISTKP